MFVKLLASSVEYEIKITSYYLSLAQKFVTLTLVFDLLIEYLNLGYIFWLVGTKALIFHMSVPCDKTFVSTKTFDIATLMFDLLVKNLNLGYIFWINGMYEDFDISREYPFWLDLSMGKKFLTLWPWCLTSLIKTLTFKYGYYLLNVRYYGFAFRIVIRCN
jgi:hypothetical protein